MRAGRRADRGEEVLRFPVPTEPLPAHPSATVEMILVASAEMLPVWNADSRLQQRRLARKCPRRFTLHPSQASEAESRES
jgi:hypothetical protein